MNSLVHRGTAYREPWHEENDPVLLWNSPPSFVVFLTGEKRSRQCTQGNVANLQKYKASKKDRSCKSKKTSTQVLASYSSVSTTFILLWYLQV